MVSRTVALFAFVVWSLICWNWYVCGIKMACGPDNATGRDLNDGIEVDTQAALVPAERRPLTYDYQTPEDEKVQVIEFDDHVEIHFPYKSVQKEEDAAVDEYLSRLAQQLAGTSQEVRIEGHADFVGGSKYNTQLGLRRAKSIRSILIRKGLREDQVALTSHGDLRPIATNDTPEGRYRNRRVEIRVLQ